MKSSVLIIYAMFLSVLGVGLICQADSSCKALISKAMTAKKLGTFDHPLQDKVIVARSSIEYQQQMKALDNKWAEAEEKVAKLTNSQLAKIQAKLQQPHMTDKQMLKLRDEENELQMDLDMTTAKVATSEEGKQILAERAKLNADFKSSNSTRYLMSEGHDFDHVIEIGKKGSPEMTVYMNHGSAVAYSLNHQHGGSELVDLSQPDCKITTLVEYGKNIEILNPQVCKDLIGEKKLIASLDESDPDGKKLNCKEQGGALTAQGTCSCSNGKKIDPWSETCLGARAVHHETAQEKIETSVAVRDGLIDPTKGAFTEALSACQGHAADLAAVLGAGVGPKVSGGSSGVGTH
jgi:hypothetical protein